jgi:hypothetical protein
MHKSRGAKIYNSAPSKNIALVSFYLFHVALSLCMNLMMMGAPDGELVYVRLFNATTAPNKFRINLGGDKWRPWLHSQNF